MYKSIYTIVHRWIKDAACGHIWHTHLLLKPQGVYCRVRGVYFSNYSGWVSIYGYHERKALRHGSDSALTACRDVSGMVWWPKHTQTSVKKQQQRTMTLPSLIQNIILPLTTVIGILKLDIPLTFGSGYIYFKLPLTLVSGSVFALYTSLLWFI